MSLKDILTQSNDRLRAIKPKVEELAKATENIKEVTATPYSLSKGSVACDADGLIVGTSPFVHKADLTYNVEFPASGDVMLSTSGCEAKKVITRVVMEDWVNSGGSLSSSYSRVAYGNGRFVATYSSTVTSTSSCAYSDDGITWKFTSLPASGKWTDVAFGEINGEGRFIATGIGVAAYSYDGVTWTSFSIGFSGNTGSVVFGNGRCVITALSYGYIFYSDDGDTWTKVLVESSSGFLIGSSVYGAGHFVTLHSNGLLVSDNGEDWEFASFAASSIAYGNGKFVAGYSGGVMVSDNCEDWTGITLPFSIAIGAFGTANGRPCFLALGNSGRFIAYSEDGIEWHKHFQTSALTFSRLAYGGGRFFSFITDSTYYWDGGSVELMLS